MSPSAAARPHRRRRPVLWGALLGGLLLQAGCLIIPVDYHEAGSRQNINTQTPSRLVPGVTTREEVLFALGEPDFASEDGQRLGYAWTKVKMLVLYGAYYTGGVAEVPRSYIVEVTFDVTGRVLQSRLLKEWGPQVPPARELAPQPATGA